MAETLSKNFLASVLSSVFTITPLLEIITLPDFNAE
jgi:hypothetical protein